MLVQTDIHVIPHGNGWAVRAEGRREAESVHKTRTQAILAGLKVARERDAKLVVYGRTVQAIGARPTPEQCFAVARYDALN